MSRDRDRADRPGEGDGRRLAAGDETTSLGVIQWRTTRDNLFEWPVLSQRFVLASELKLDARRLCQHSRMA